MAKRIEVKVHLLLGGSFFPLHKGHLALLECGRYYVESRRWLRQPIEQEIEVSVCEGFICPSHPSSLARKIPECQHLIESSFREEQIERFLNAEGPAWIRIHSDLMRSDSNVGFARAVSSLRSEIEAKSTPECLHRLVQVSGCDSRVKAIANSALSGIKQAKKEFKKQHDKEDLPLYFELLALRQIFVRDRRPIPDENVTLLETFPHVISTKECESGVLSEAMLLPRSSSIVRFVDSDTYYEFLPKRDICAKFDPRWLIDTGVTLGRGRQGIVRLMLLGGDHYVAVKAFHLSQSRKKARGKPSYDREARIWSLLAEESPDCVPRLYAAQKLTLTNATFGMIVSEIGIPMNALFPILKEMQNRSFQQKDDDFVEFFAFFESTNITRDPDNVPWTTKWLSEFIATRNSSEDRIEFKTLVAKSIIENVLPGIASAGILHRDLKTDNLLYIPRTQSVVTCDFGVGVVAKDAKKDSDFKMGARGSLRLYPQVAVDYPNYYDPWCDSFFASLSLWEILHEQAVFAGTGTQAVIQSRREGQVPEISHSVKEQFASACEWMQHTWEMEREYALKFEK